MTDYRHAIAPLALGTFAVGTEGLAVSGMLPEISAGLHVSVSAAGQLVTVFAVAYALGAPLLAVYGSRIAPKHLLAGGLGLFAAGNVLAALAPGYGMMIAVRVFMALSAAAFVPTASAAGAALAPPESRGKALAVVWGGFTIATVTGVPLAARIAGLASWRWAFAFIAVLASLAAIGIAALVPHIDKPPAVTARAFLDVVRTPAVAGVVLVGFLMQSGQFLVYTYIAPVTRLLTGGGNLIVTGALLLFGVAAIAGNALGGAGTDRIGSRRVVLASLAVFTAAYLVFGVLGGLARSPLTIAVAAVTTIAWGLASWAFVPPQQAQLVRAAPQHSAVALSLNVSAIYAGIAIGGGLGGAILAGGHTGTLPYAGAVLTAAALLTAAVADRRARQSGRRQPAECGAVPMKPKPVSGEAIRRPREQLSPFRHAAVPVSIKECQMPDIESRAVVRVSRGKFDPGRFAEVHEMMMATSSYLIPAIRRLPGLIIYFAGASPDGSMVNVSVWESGEHAAQMGTMKEMMVDARKDAAAVGVDFINVVNYPIAWTI